MRWGAVLVLLAAACEATPAPQVSGARSPCPVEPRRDVWTAMSIEGAPRASAQGSVVAVAHDDSVLLGMTRLGGPTALSFYSVCAGTWEPVSMRGAPERVADVGWIGGRLFAWSVAAEPTTHVYERNRHRWAAHDLPVRARRAPQVGSKVVLFDEDAERHTRFDSGTIVDVCSGETVAVMPANAPTPRVLPTTAALEHEGALFVFGGRQRHADAMLGDGAMLELTTGRWSRLPAAHAPAPHVHGTALPVGGEVIVWADGGGARFQLAARRWLPFDDEGAPAWSDGVHVATPTHFVSVSGSVGALYDLAEAAWSHFDLPTEMHRGAVKASALGDTHLLFWDRDGAWFWRFEPRSRRWSRIPADTTARRRPAIAVSGHVLLVWGGWSPLPDAGADCPGEASCAAGEERHMPRVDGALLRL